MIWFLKNNQKDAWKNCEDYFFYLENVWRQNKIQLVDYFEFPFQLAINLRLDGQ